MFVMYIHEKSQKSVKKILNLLLEKVIIDGIKWNGMKWNRITQMEG